MRKIKTLFSFLFVLVGVLMLTTSCDLIFGESGKLTDDVHNIIPPDILKEFKNIGIEIHGGKTPPNIEGTYKISPCVLVKSNFSDNFSPGHKFADKFLTFSKQDNAKLTIVCDYVQSNERGPLFPENLQHAGWDQIGPVFCCPVFCFQTQDLRDPDIR